MMNTASIMKIMSAKNQFTSNHPKFVAFLKAVFSQKIEEGTVIEIVVKKPGQEELASNLKIQQSDLELMQELQEMMR